MNRELVTGLAQLSAEKGLPKEVVGDIIARALKRAYGAEENIDVKVDISTGAFRVYLLKTVVDKVEDPKLQILLDAAKRIKPDAQLGDIIPLEESAAALGRIGAQTAKQVIQQSLREAEREQVFAEYADRAPRSPFARASQGSTLAVRASASAGCACRRSSTSSVARRSTSSSGTRSPSSTSPTPSSRLTSCASTSSRMTRRRTSSFPTGSCRSRSARKARTRGSPPSSPAGASASAAGRRAR